MSAWHRLYIRLTEADWDDTLRGWRCPPLAVPGAIVDALFVEGARADTARYEVLVEQSLIRWVPSEQPQRVAATIRLTEALTLGTETDRWKKLAVLLPVAATIISALIGFAAVTLRPKPQVPDGQHSVNLPTPVPHKGVVENSEGAVVDKAAEIFPDQPIRGYSSPDAEWLKFSIIDTSSTRVSILFRNLRQTGAVWLNVYDAQKRRITSVPITGETGEARFLSTQADNYYVSIVETGPGTTVYYEMTVTAK